MRTHRIGALVALTTLGLLAAGCAGDAGGTPAASPAVEATANATPDAASSPAPPAGPATPADTATPAPLATPAPSATPAPAATQADTASTNASGAAPVGKPVPAPELAELMLPDRSTFDLASLRGQPVLVFFGYTHCPDVCPATMGELFGVFEQEPTAQAVFVSVDPERDTPEFLEEWTRYLPDNLHALTGSPGAVRRAADGYGVKYARVETTSTAGYAMSHTAELYLIDADGQLLLAYPFGTHAAEIVEDLRALDAGQAIG